MEHTSQLPLICAPTGSRIRAEFGGEVVADSREAVLLRRSASELAYGFPGHALSVRRMTPCAAPADSPWGGEAAWFDVDIEAGTAARSAFRLPHLPEDAPEPFYFLRFGAMDRWCEEDETLVCHPRDPFTRVDVRRSRRHIRVVVDDVTVAETHHPLLLFETGLPVRYYIPWVDVDDRYLQPSTTETVCCYKGRARYWHIHTGQGHYPDRAWDYPDPMHDAERVRAAVCFYQTKLTLYVDGTPEPRAPRYFTRD